MKCLSLLLLLCTVCLADTCEKHPVGVEAYSFFWIKNNSSDTIWYLTGESYPDTVIPNTPNLLLKLKPSEQKKFIQSETMEDFFSKLPADTISLFFFNSDTLAKYGFTDVRDHYRILKRKDISIEDLSNNSNTVEYP